MTQLHTV